jgi:hypothetical protein
VKSRGKSVRQLWGWGRRKHNFVRFSLVCSSYLTGNTLVSATEANRLMPFRETVAVCCENRTEHTDTFRAENAELQYVKAGDIYNYLSSKGYIS